MAYSLGNILSQLDKVASQVQDQGLIALASDIDSVSNSLESFAFRNAFMRGMQVPFDQVDRAEDRLEYLEDILTLLGNTQLAKETKAEGMFSKLKQLVVGSKNQAVSEGMGVILNDFRVKSFQGWLQDCEAKYGKVIPDKFFRGQKGPDGAPIPGTEINRFHSTFEDLGAAFHILDEKLTSGAPSSADTLSKKLERKDTLEDFAKKQLEGDAPKKSWGELDNLFKKAATDASIPQKFVHLQGLVRALKKAEAEQGLGHRGFR